ncbi:hypothetical protein GWK47_054598 [Chionoecetes opilio]|uniref:Uncharacterized protein n=1 Tax=Chionoecetes opilio TaxID=41210 RepID=A0A8J4XYT3_CHIOP|nr:hypothetical protein GWK47_054598 [Chionoecetes opilio]
MRVAHNEVAPAPPITSIDAPTSSDTALHGGPDAHPQPSRSWCTCGPDAWTDSQRLNTIGNPSQVLPAGYFKLYYDIKVTTARGRPQAHPHADVMRCSRRKVQKAVTFYRRTGAWFAPPECVSFDPLRSDTQLADTDQLAGLAGARAGMHLFTVQGSDPGDRWSQPSRSGVLYHTQSTEKRVVKK